MSLTPYDEQPITSRSVYAINELMKKNPHLVKINADDLAKVFQAGVVTGHEIAREIFKRAAQEIMDEK